MVVHSVAQSTHNDKLTGKVFWSLAKENSVRSSAVLGVWLNLSVFILESEYCTLDDSCYRDHLFSIHICTTDSV